MISSAEIWSEEKKALVTWNISLVDDDSYEHLLPEERPNVIVAKYGDEILKFSPTSTDDEILNAIRNYNFTSQYGEGALLGIAYFPDIKTDEQLQEAGEAYLAKVDN